MSLQVVTITEQDGALGSLPVGQRAPAFVGVSTGGTLELNTPAAFARVKDVVAACGSGPLVEMAARWIATYGRPCVVVRTGNTTAASLGTLNDDGVAGSATVTNGTGKPVDDYEPYVIVEAGGTVGEPGITYRYSLDGGRTLSTLQSLGADDEIQLPGYDGPTFEIGQGTLARGDVFFRADKCAYWDGSEITAALGALKASAIDWELAVVIGDVSTTTFDTISAAMAGMPEKAWIGHVAVPDVGMSAASYLSSLSGFGAKADTYGMLCAGACKVPSAISGRSYRRSTIYAIAPAVAAASEEVDVSAPALGPLTGVSIRDERGNPDEHDEALTPGLDDARFAVLRTYEGLAGVYINNPRLFSAEGSDFEFVQHRRVMNLAKRTLRLYFVRRLSLPIIVDGSTGFILESEALEIESGANAVLRSVLRSKPKASAVQFTLSRTDNLLSTKTLTGQARIVPLAYPKAIELDIGFSNPALQVQTA